MIVAPKKGDNLNQIHALVSVKILISTHGSTTPGTGLKQSLQPE